LIFTLYIDHDDDDDDDDDDDYRREIDSVQLSDEASPTVSERRPKRRHGRRSSEWIESCAYFLLYRTKTFDLVI